MCQIKMKSKYKWANEYISPGVVGSVGDTNLSVRYKQSCPELAMRWSPWTVGKRESKLGSNVQNGFIRSYTSKGRGAETYEYDFYNPMKHEYGFTFQDLRPPSKMHMEVMGELPQFSWNNMKSNIRSATLGNPTFQQVPGEFKLVSGVPRGQSKPRLVGMEFGDSAPQTQGLQFNMPKIV